MNCFSHALPFLDDPVLAVGTCIPDWLAACDRKCRAREKKAELFVDHEDPFVASIARGVVRHHRDDYWFHTGTMFQKLNIQFAVEIREQFENEQGMRTGFVGHILIEMYLDAWLHQTYPGKLAAFYETLGQVDSVKVQNAINLFATRPTHRLAPSMLHFVEERYIFDYADDAGALYRVNRVLDKIGLAPIDNRVVPWMASARKRVYENISGLLEKYAMELKTD